MCVRINGRFISFHAFILFFFFAFFAVARLHSRNPGIEVAAATNIL